MPKGDYGLHQKETFKTRLSHQKSGRSDVIDCYWKKSLAPVFRMMDQDEHFNMSPFWPKKKTIELQKEKTSTIINPLIDQPSSLQPIDWPTFNIHGFFPALIPLKLTMKLPETP